MNSIPIISVIAKCSGMGKTTFLVKLIKELVAKGVKVGTIKSDAHGFEIDKPGKDSWRHAQAGAKATAIIGPEKFAVIHKTSGKENLDKVAKIFEDVDIILVEGYKLGDKPKIEVIRAEKGKEITAPLDEVIAIVTDVEQLDVSVPKFSLDDGAGVANFLIDKYLNNRSSQQNGHDLTHFDQQGRARMVDVTQKETTTREAIAKGEIWMSRDTLDLISQGKVAKGDVLSVAQVAGIMGVKETSHLIPMCHPLLIGSVNISFQLDYDNCKVDIECKVKINGQTGVEMEALTGVNIAALTIYDMCKAADKNMVINNIRLVKKTGGKSGVFIREE